MQGKEPRSDDFENIKALGKGAGGVSATFVQAFCRVPSVKHLLDQPCLLMPRHRLCFVTSGKHQNVWGIDAQLSAHLTCTRPHAPTTLTAFVTH
jgi:hypothetical protein